MDELLDNEVELGGAEDGLHVAEDLLNIESEALHYQLPVNVLLEVLCELHFSHSQVIGVIDKEEEKAVIISVVDDLQVARIVILILDIQLVVDLHKHGVGLDKLHDLLHL